MKSRRKSARRRLLRAALLALDGVVLFSFFAGFLAAYLHPRFWWWGGMVAVGLPYVAMAVGLSSLLVFALARRRRALVWLHIAALLLIAVRFFPVGGIREPLAAEDGDLVVMSLNLPRHPETDHGADQVFALVERYKPHLLGIQESVVYATSGSPKRVRSTKKLVRVIDELGYTSAPPTDGPADRNWKNWYQPVLARARIIDQGQIVLPYSEGDIRPMRGLRTEFEWQGRKAVHYNLHLHTYGSEKPWSHKNPRLWDVDFWEPFVVRARQAFVRRAWQAKQVRALIDSETLPVIVSGDFNGTPHNWSFRRIAAGFQDAFAIAGEGWGGTYHTDLPLFRIDFVLADENWEVVSAVTPDSDREVSDHRAIIARLRWRSNP